MVRRLWHIALVAALVVGVVAMHSWGHRGHGSEPETDSAATVMAHHHAGMAHHDAPDAEPEGDESPSDLLSLLGFMVCGGVMLRGAVEFLRPLFSRVLAALAALAPTVEAHAVRLRWRPPPLRLTPTSLLLNRIAVLRI